jgi:hypothetical protein
MKFTHHFNYISSTLEWEGVLENIAGNSAQGNPLKLSEKI